MPRDRAHVRFAILAAGLLLFTALLGTQARAQTLRQIVRFDVSSLRVETTAAGTALASPGNPSTWEDGYPEIPYLVVTVLVPQGAQIQSVRATGAPPRALHPGLKLDPAVPQRTDAGDVVMPPAARWKLLDSDLYPPVEAEPIGSGLLHGYRLASIRVYPLRYDLSQGGLQVRERLELEIELAPDPVTTLDRARFDAALEARAAQQVARLVANPDAIASYARRIGVLVERDRRGFHPSQAPSLEGSPVEYVIITSQAMQASFQVLADWKTQRGIPTVVRTLEWIQANYRHGSDLQETIRTFIQDAYAKWSASYVLLGGDTDVVPARYGFSQFGPVTEEHIPTDMYFACLDGNWNADGDAVWGEAAVPFDVTVDDADLYAEVFVGRLPVSTAAETQSLVAKIIEYENPLLVSYQSSMLFLSEVLFPVDWAPGEGIIEDGAEYSEFGLLPLVDPCVQVTKLYQNHTAYIDASPLSLSNSLVQLTSGYGFVNHIGHGFRYNMSVSDQSLLTHHALGLGNGDERFVLYFLNCTATAFDFPCLAESFLDAPGGAVAVLGASRAAFPLPSRNYNIDFFAALFDAATPKNVGQLFVASRDSFTANAYYDTSDHYTHFLYNLLADPEMIVHTCNLQTTGLVFPPSLGLGLTTVNVTVTNNGTPRAGARVCLQKDTEEYVHGLTNGAGQVALDFVGETAGSATLTVSGQNMRTRIETIPVLASGGAYVHVQSLSVDDDGSGGTTGNGDGFIDAGETVSLHVTCANSGTASATGVTGVLRITNPWVTMQDSTFSPGSIANGGQVVQSGAVRFLVGAGAPDGGVLACQWTTTDGSSTWNDSMNRVLHAPRMELVLLDVIDPMPGGNNDGTIQAGETFDLVPVFKNYGSGSASGLVATLSSSDPDLVLTQTMIAVGTATPLQEVTGPTRFRLQENTLDANLLMLQLTDGFGRIQSWSPTLRGPGAPDAPTLDPSQGSTVVVVTWTPTGAPDLAGYHVYRSLTGSPPWSRVTLDRTDNVAYYRDGSLAASTQYFYYVTAVDSSGNESGASPLAQVNTSPPQLAGWPIQMGAVSSCPPAVGDITGDGNMEIVAGNIRVYAWDWEGIELRDADDDPQTWGVFSTEIQTVTAAVVLAELDPAPGLEAFVGAWGDAGDGTKTLVLRGDGSLVGNWPQNPSPTATPPGYWGAPGAIDLDGDGFAEVFAPAKDGNLYAWHGDGTPVGAGAAFKSGLGTWSRCSPTFANMDGDPAPEIVYATPTGTLHIWNADGTNVPRFPMTLGNATLSSTALGDVDGDGDIEVVLVSENDSLYVIDTAKGKRMPGWPVFLSVDSNPVSPSPALADFDFDGDLEIVVAHNALPVTQSSVRVYSHTGQLLAGWPRLVDSHTSESSPIVADFSGDGVPDIVFGNENSLIYGWDKNGNPLPGFPLTVGGEVRSTPFATDVDGDGTINLVLAGWDQNLWIWDFTAPFVRAAAQWPTFKHDAQRTGYYSHTEQTPTGTGEDPDASAAVPRSAFLGPNVPNPFNPVTSIAYGVPATGGTEATDVRIQVLDVRGRHVRHLVQGTQAPGTYKALWDGRDDHGREVQSGVYFFRLHVAGTAEVRKSVLLR